LNYKDALAVIKTAWARLLVCCYSVVKDRSALSSSKKAPRCKAAESSEDTMNKLLCQYLFTLFSFLPFDDPPANFAVGSSSPHRQEAANYKIAMDQSRTKVIC
jgi:hypothetical protein